MTPLWFALARAPGATLDVTSFMDSGTPVTDTVPTDTSTPNRLREFVATVGF